MKPFNGNQGELETFQGPRIRKITNTRYHDVFNAANIRKSYGEKQEEHHILHIEGSTLSAPPALYVGTEGVCV